MLAKFLFKILFKRNIASKVLTDSAFMKKNFYETSYNSFYYSISMACNFVEIQKFTSAVYSYLSSYEIAKTLDDECLKIALSGLDNAWDIAIMLKWRSMAENLLEIFNMHKSREELIIYSEKLSSLMIEKLQDLDIVTNNKRQKKLANTVDKLRSFVETGYDSKKGIKDSNIETEIRSLQDLINQVKDSKIKNIKISGVENLDIPDDIADQLANILKSAFSEKNQEKEENTKTNQTEKKPNSSMDNDAYYIKKNILRYENLVGYNEAINYMRELGLGTNTRSQYKDLIQKLNKEHGLNRASHSKTMIFKSPSRMDAKIFMEATASEINMPIIHLHMEENISGANVLCMMASADSSFRLNPARTGFNGKGILILEDVDKWEFPEVNFDDLDGFSSFMNAQISRGVAEVINLIEVALEDPNILVLASVKEDVASGQFSKMMFQDYFEIFIDFPNDIERLDIWKKLAQDHPSLRAFNLQKLVDYSKNMSRYDIEVAAHEALEEAYQEGIERKQYIPLSITNIIEKLAENQPIDSSEYKQLEDVATEDFKKELDNIDDILK